MTKIFKELRWMNGEQQTAMLMLAVLTIMGFVAIWAGA